MSTFIGDFVCKVDEKGRFILPAAFRTVLVQGQESSLVVRKDFFENCLVFYPYSQWEVEVEKVKSRINLFNREQNQFFRDFYRSATQIPMDASGRVLLPRRLMELIGAPKEVVVVGVDSKMELWSKELYEKSTLNHEQIGLLAEKLLGNINESI